MESVHGCFENHVESFSPQKRCLSVPVQDIRLLVLSFPIPDLIDYYDSKVSLIL